MSSSVIENVDPKAGDTLGGNDVIREKILHILRIFPKLSQSMIVVGVGTSIPSSLFHQALDRLLREGLVQKEPHTVIAPTGRAQTYTCFSLVRKPIADAA